jgi:hypothetical protein
MNHQSTILYSLFIVVIFWSCKSDKAVIVANEFAVSPEYIEELPGTLEEIARIDSVLSSYSVLEMEFVPCPKYEKLDSTLPHNIEASNSRPILFGNPNFYSPKTTNVAIPDAISYSNDNALFSLMTCSDSLESDEWWEQTILNSEYSQGNFMLVVSKHNEEGHRLTSEFSSKFFEFYHRFNNQETAYLQTVSYLKRKYKSELLLRYYFCGN